MSNIQPFGTSADGADPDLVPIKLFGCTVVDFNVSADWSAQGGSLSCRLIEDEVDGDRLRIPVLGSPTLFELKNSQGNVLFQYIGLVDSFSRSSNNGKTYSLTLTSPLRILEATSVILDGYTGLGSTLEGAHDLSGLTYQDYGSNNSLINVMDQSPGTYNWWNVCNLINVYGILENDDIKYRVATNWDSEGNPISFGGYGFSGRSQDGIPLIKLMWALHYGINHFQILTNELRQKTHAGNLLFGRHNYNINDGFQAVPYYYHFDAIHFYNQVVNRLGPQYRVEGQYKTLREIITAICDEANVEFYSYIDIYSDPDIGSPTLQEYDPNWITPAKCSWANYNFEVPADRAFLTTKFYQTYNNGNNGNYGGTIRVNVIDKNTFYNPHRPFSNIAYNLIGLEVPDLKDDIWFSDHKSGIHPGRRPGQPGYGLANNVQTYSDPLDSEGLDNPEQGFDDIDSKVGTVSVANGGSFPVEETGIDGKSLLFDPEKFNDLRLKSSDISIKMNDVTTMKVITGGYQSRIVTVPGNMLRHYWGDIILPNASDPRTTNDTATDAFGLNETSSRKIPVVTPILDPRDVDDYILIDMRSIFGDYTCVGVLQNGIYAASMLEIRCAMKSEQSWKAFIDKYKFQKIRNLRNCLYPQCGGGSNSTKKYYEQTNETINLCGGLGYVGVSNQLGIGNTFSLSQSQSDGFTVTIGPSGNATNPPHVRTADGTGPFGLGIDIPCAVAEINIRKYLLPAIFEKVKEIGDTHYGKSWYAPVPYCQVIEDLDGENLVGNFKRSWELTDSAYVEPSYYYQREIPQSNLFISDGKISPFVNYDHNFVIQGNSGVYDKSYAQEITNLVGQETQVFNFSEYSLDALCSTKYGSVNVIHAAPENIESQYTFLPFVYDRIYNRALLPYSDMITGQSLRWVNTKTSNPQVPLQAGQQVTQYKKDYLNNDDVPATSGIAKSGEDNKFNISTNLFPDCPGGVGQIPSQQGYFDLTPINGVPSVTQPSWLAQIVPTLQSLDYVDNGRFSFPFVKFTTARVFLPVPSPASPYTVNRTPSLDGFNAFVGAQLSRNAGNPCGVGSVIPVKRRQSMITEDTLISVLNPFQACVAPRSFSYPQISTRYVYGPWMTSYAGIIFRGKVEYEQDESLVPENFLIPINFGPFGTYNLSQTSGFAGMNLAAQGRANAIDNFALFALEEGSITFPGAPGIKRIGDSLYGIQQVSDLRLSISSESIETTYGFKTISPKFGKNTRDLEKKLTKISNEIKKLKLR